jgi:hypothetical protein
MCDVSAPYEKAPALAPTVFVAVPHEGSRPATIHQRHSRFDPSHPWHPCPKVLGHSVLLLPIGKTEFEHPLP